jgi:hypothetical protein
VEENEFYITHTVNILRPECKILEINKINSEDLDEIGFDIICEAPDTPKMKICLRIDNLQQCCEEWGYLCTDDNVKDFIGSTLMKIDETYTARAMDGGTYTDRDVLVFTTFHTSNGNLQFKAYTDNRFYGHETTMEIYDVC